MLESRSSNSIEKKPFGLVLRGFFVGWLCGAILFFHHGGHDVVVGFGAFPDDVEDFLLSVGHGLAFDEQAELVL